MSLQALREQRAVKLNAARDMASAKDFDVPAYQAIMKEVDDIELRIEAINAVNAKTVEDAQRSEVLHAADRLAHDKGDEGSRIFAKWLRNGAADFTAEDMQTFRNTMSTTTGSEGGFTVPTTTASTLIETLKAFGGVRAAATVLVTETGNPLSFPTADATAEVGELAAENATATALDTAFGTIALTAYKYSSKSVAVPIELLQDSAIDIEAYINQLLATRLGRITNTHFTTGTGSSQPRGIVTGAATGVTAANSTSQVTAVTYASLVALQHSVDPAYRAAPGVGWMFNDNTLRSLRQMVDGQSRPIFVPGYETGNPGGAPDTLLGSPIYINQDVATMAASARSILFGDLSKYYVRDVMGVTLKRYEDSAFGLKGQVGFCAWLRSGGNLMDPAAVKVFINAAS
jgi:HK97 family phage major capsid protein